MSPLFGKKAPKKEGGPGKAGSGTQGSGSGSKRRGKAKEKGRGSKGAEPSPGKGRRSKRTGKDAAGGGEGEGEELTCEVPDCKEEYARSVSFKKAKAAMSGWKLKDGPRRIHVCQEHYREFKKATKKDRELDRAGWMERAGRRDGRR